MTKGVDNPGVIMTCILCVVTLQTLQAAPQVFVSKLFRRQSAAETSLSSERPATFTECLRECVVITLCRGFCHDSLESVCHLADAVNQRYYLNGIGSRFDCFVVYCSEDKGYLRLQGLCVKLYTFPLEYLEATAHCTQDGAHLLHYKTAVDMAAVSELVALQGGVQSQWWIGADCLASTGNFVWRSEGTALGPDAMWSPGEPNNQYNEYCAVVFTDTLLMNDVPCSLPLQFVCQVDL